MQERDLADAMEYARSAEKKGNWQVALDRWENALNKHPLTIQIHIGCASAFMNLGRFLEAKNILNAASDKFPKNHDIWHDLARLAERLGDWPEAQRCWQGFLECEGRHWWSYTALAFTLRQQNKNVEANNVMLNAQIEYPDAWELLAEHARYSGRVGDLSVALEQWKNALKLNPSLTMLHIGYSDALIAVNRIDDGYEALLLAARKCPNDSVIWMALARIAEIQKNWIEVEYFCRKYYDKKGQDSNLIILLSLSILNQNRVDDFLSIFSITFKEKLDDINLISEFILLSEKFSISKDNIIFNEIEKSIEHPDFTSSDHQKLLFTLTKFAKFRQNYLRYRERSQVYYVQYPSGRLAREMFFEACELSPRDNDINHGSLEELAETLPFLNEISSKEADKRVLMKFESLGGNIAGCEFGTTQRHFGIESLSLLRWASITIDNLISALNNRFLGVGIIENTIIENQPQHYDWRARDTSYGIQMDHTHLDQKTVTQDTARKQLSIRMSFLARKLISDLEEGDKIFVYRYFKGTISNETLNQLRDAISKYNIKTKIVLVQETKENLSSIKYEIVDSTLVYATRKESETIDHNDFLLKITQWTEICTKAAQEFV